MAQDRDELERPAPAQEPAQPEPTPLPPVPGLAGISMTAIARQPPDQRSATLARMAAGAGNRALSRAAGASVARVEDMSLAGPEILKNMQEERARRLKIDLSTASDAEKIAEIRRLIAEGDEVALKATGLVWHSFGDRMSQIALAHRGLFETSMDAKAVSLRSGMQPLLDSFKEAVEAKARDNLRQNREFVRREMYDLGMDAPGMDDDPNLLLERSAGTDSRMRDLQLLAERVSKAQAGMQAARRIPVGEDMVSMPGLFGLYVDQRGPAFFDPKGPPKWPGAGPHAKDWKAVKAEYDKLELIVEQASAQSPVMFGLVGQSPEAVKNFAGQEAMEARAALKPTLLALIGKISEAEGLIGDELDWREMKPVHEQLQQTPPWGNRIERELLRGELITYNRDKLLSDLGLGALSGLGFLFATFATSGGAAFIGAAVGIGASAAQAKGSIEDYYTKAKARAARTGNPALDIISQEQVDSARVQAILDGALAALDVLGGVAEIGKLVSPAIKLAQAGEAGYRATAESVLYGAMRGGDQATQAAAVERAVAELGTDGAARAAGMTPDQLAKVLPADSETAKKLNFAAESAKQGGVGPFGFFSRTHDHAITRLESFGALPVDEARMVISHAFEKIGYTESIGRAGGWMTVTTKFGKDDPLVIKLEAWRKSLIDEATAYVKQASRGETQAIRTGTPEGTSDVDVSTFGLDAAQSAGRVKEYLASRLGTRQDRLDLLIGADAAADPTRLHLQDIAPNLSETMHTQIREISFLHQEKLVLARLHYDARNAGDLLRAGQLEGISLRTGAGEIDKTWKPMSPRVIAGLEMKIDEWATQLARLERAGADEAARQPLMQKIARAQAEVLANNPNMYMDMGNIKRLVTRRGIDKKAIEEAIEVAVGKLDPIRKARLDRHYPQERLIKIVGEGPSIEAALRTIKSGTSEDPETIAKALKALGKHGDRVVKEMGSDVADIDVAAWTKMSDRFESIVDRAKEAGALRKEVLDDLQGLQREMTAHGNRLEAAMTDVTARLREELRIGPGLSADEAAGIRAWAQAEGLARARVEDLKKSIYLLHKLSIAGRIPARDWEFDYPGEPPDVVPMNVATPGTPLGDYAEHMQTIGG